MKVTYEKKNAMTFIGYHTEIRPEEGYQKCPEFWDREYAAKYARLWQTMKPENEVEKAILENGIGMYAICADSQCGFTYQKACDHLNVNVSRKMTFTALVDSMTVHTKERITFPLTCGMEVEA